MVLMVISLQVKVDSKPYQVSPRCVAYALQKVTQGRTRVATVAGYNHTPRHDGNSRVVYQFHTGTKAKWKGQALPQPSKINEALM